MKRRMLALLLALVLILGMLPTAFAEDTAAPAGEAQTAAEEKREETEQPEQENPDEAEQEKAAEEAEQENPEEAEQEKAAEEPAALASEEGTDVEDPVSARLLGEWLKEGYYLTENDGYEGAEGTTLDISSFTTEEPTNRKNYLHYKDNVLTVYGEVNVLSSNEENGSALHVLSGNLTVNGTGAFHMHGIGLIPLTIDETASVDFALDAENFTGFGNQLYIISNGAQAVSGNLTISSAARVWIAAKETAGTDEPIGSEENPICNTIEGDADITAKSVSLHNEAGGACVLGSLTANVPEYLQIINQSTEFAALEGGTYTITTDYLNMQSYCGQMVNGDLTLEAVGKSEDGTSFLISGCTADDVAVVEGNVTASGGSLAIINQNKFSTEIAGQEEDYKKFHDYRATGVLLKGDLTLTNGTGLTMNRSDDVSDKTEIVGNITLINCNADEDYVFSIRRDGTGAAIDGNITLKNSKLQITADSDDNGQLYKTAGVLNCNLEMENSQLFVYGWNNDWTSFKILDDSHEWYAGAYPEDEISYTKSTDKAYTPSASQNAVYLKIRSGNKMGSQTTPTEPTERLATFDDVTISGEVNKALTATLTIKLQGDTFNFSALENGVVNGKLQKGVELSDYLMQDMKPGINWPSGVWNIKSAKTAAQGTDTLVLEISGTAGMELQKPIGLTISGSLLESSKDLAVVTNENACWNIQPAAAPEVDFNNIRTAEEFALAAGGEGYAEVSGTTVTLQASVYPKRTLTLTGNFTIDLNGHNIFSEELWQYGEAVLYSKSGIQTVTDSSFKGEGTAGYLNNGICVNGGEVTLESIDVFAARVEKGTLHTENAAFLGVSNFGGTITLKDTFFRDFILNDGEVQMTNCATAPKEGVNTRISMQVRDGRLTIIGGTYEGAKQSLFQQNGGNVTIEGGTFHGMMEVQGGVLDITGGTFEAYTEKVLCLYQQGGHVSIQNAKLIAEPATQTADDGTTYTVQQCIQVNGGTLEISNAKITGAVTALGKSAKSTTLTLTGGTSVEAEANEAVRVFGGTVTIEDACGIYSTCDALLISGKNAAATISDSKLESETAAAVKLLDGGSFTMESSIVEGAAQGIFVGSSKSKLTVNSGHIKSDKVALYVAKGNTVKLAGGKFEGGEKAIFTEATNMKGWLQKGCEMTGDALAPGFDAEKTNQTDAGTVIVAEVNKEAAQHVSALIDEVTANVTLDSEEALANAEAAYQALTKQQQALVKNYKKLTTAKKTWDKLKENETYVNAAAEIDALIEAIPEDTANISVDDQAAIEAAAEAYAQADKKAKSFVDKTLSKRLTAAQKTLKKNVTAGEKVSALFEKIQAASVEELSLTRDRKTVEAAKKALDNLKTEAQKSFVDPEIRNSIEAYSARMELLKSNETLIKAAEKAVKALPAAAKIKATDEKKVNTAIAAMQALEEAEKTSGISLSIGEENTQKYEDSLAAYNAYKQEAEAFIKEYLAPLNVLEDVDKEHERLVTGAREAYKNLGTRGDVVVTKNVQSFITKQDLAQLTALEKLLKKNQAAAAKVDKLIAKIPAEAATDVTVAKDKKNCKAIDAAWKAYDGDKGLTAAQKTFLTKEQHLIDSYNLAHDITPPGDNTLHIQFVDSKTEQPIKLQEIFAADATFGLGRSTKSRKELTVSVFEQANPTDTEFVFRNAPDLGEWNNYQLYFDYNEVNYEHPATPSYPYTISSYQLKQTAENEYSATIELTKHFLQVDGVTVSKECAKDFLENGKASYDFDTNTLTLNGAALGTTLENMPVIETNIRDLTIEIPEGTTSTVKSTRADGIVCKGLHIEGTGTLTFETDGAYQAIRSTSYGETGTLQITGTTVRFDEYSGGITCGAFIVEKDATIESIKEYLRSSFVDAASIRISDSTVDLMSCDTHILGTHGDIEISGSVVTLYSTMSCSNVERSAYLLFAETGTVQIDAASIVNIMAPNVETDKDHQLLCATNGITLGKGVIIRDQDGKKCTVYRPKVDGNYGNYSVQCADGKSYPTQVFVAKSSVQMPDYTIPQ